MKYLIFLLVFLLFITANLCGIIGRKQLHRNNNLTKKVKNALQTVSIVLQVVWCVITVVIFIELLLIR